MANGTMTDLGFTTEPEAPAKKPEMTDLGLGTQQPEMTALGFKKAGEEATFGEEFKYGFAQGGTFVGNAGDYLERKFPMGRITIYTPGQGYHFPKYESPEEAYGEGASEEAIFAEQKERRARDLAAYAPEQATRPDDMSWGRGTGAFAKAVADPTTLIPLGHGVKQAAVIGGAIGGADMAAWGLGREDKIDPALTALGVVGGAGGAAGLTYMGGKLSRLFQMHTESGAKDFLGKFEARADELMEDGLSLNDAYTRAMSEMNIDEDGLTGLMVKAGKVAKTKNADVDGTTATLRKKSRKAQEDAGVYKSKKHSKAAEFMDDLLGVMSTRLKNESEAVWALQRRMDAEEHILVEDAFRKVNPFSTYIKHKLSKGERNSFKKALANDDTAGVENILARHPKLRTHFDETRKLLDDIHKQLTDAGYDVDKIDMYFPRVIKDPEGLKNKIPANIRRGLEKEMADPAKQLASPEDQAKFINQYLRGRLSDKSIDTKLGATKERKIKNVTDDIMEFYADPHEGIHTYLRDAIQDIARRKFFGRDAAAVKGNGELNIAATLDNALSGKGGSVGAVIQQELMAGRLAPEQLNQIQKLLLARHDLASRSVNGGIQDLRNIAYAATIANPMSAATQIGDIGVAAFANGIRNTAKSVLAELGFGKRYANALDLGMESIAEEFADTRKTATFLHGAFKASLFRTVDRLGKNTVINGAFRKFTARKGRDSVNTQKGLAKFKEKYSSMFGDELYSVIDDLKNKRVTHNVKMVLFNELADLQPISLSEMPLKYLQNPNARVFYMLKTFTLKQLDVLRRNVWNELKQGNVTQGTKQLGRYIALLSFFNFSAENIKHTMITGEPIPQEDVPDVLVANLIKNFGASEYLINKHGSKGEIGTMIGAMAAPPLSVVDGLIGLFTDLDNFDTHVKYAPVFGKMWYYWFGPGVERMMDNKQKEERKEFFNTDDDFWEE